MAKANIDPSEVDEIILGQVLTECQGQNPARQAAMGADLLERATTWCLNQVCGSGLRAVALAAQQIINDDARIVIAGGQESMSSAPHAVHLRSGVKMGGVGLVDTVLNDVLTDAIGRYHMGITTENIAQKYQSSREDRDIFAANSQNKAEVANNAERFREEIAPVNVP